MSSRPSASDWAAALAWATGASVRRATTAPISAATRTSTPSPTSRIVRSCARSSKSCCLRVEEVELDAPDAAADRELRPAAGLGSLVREPPAAHLLDELLRNLADRRARGWSRTAGHRSPRPTVTKSPRRSSAVRSSSTPSAGSSAAPSTSSASSRLNRDCSTPRVTESSSRLSRTTRYEPAASAAAESAATSANAIVSRRRSRPGRIGRRSGHRLGSEPVPDAAHRLEQPRARSSRAAAERRRRRAASRRGSRSSRRARAGARA